MSKLKESKKEKQERLEIQKQVIRRIFEQFDTDGSGEIDKDEFIEGMKNYFQLDETPNPNEFNEIFEAIFKVSDKASIFRKRNGQLDIKEFTRIVLAFPENLVNSPQDIVAETLFNIIDENRNGSISKKEFQDFCYKVNRDKKDQLELFKNVDFSNVDFNSDGSVSKDEFILWFWSERLNK